MRVIREIALTDIEQHLINLGSGNQTDNMKSLSRFKYYYEVYLDEDDYKSLVFLRTTKLGVIVDKENRSLENTAANAIKYVDNGNGDLGSNWNLNHLIENFEQVYTEGEIDLNGLVLRDARGSELTHPEAKLYIQDGCHRSLGYMMGIQTGKITYTMQKALIATNTQIDH